ncbi:MAG: metal ABC transporter permease [Candidatus Nanoarchaeia archaeon]
MLELLQYEFMQRALLGGLLIAISSSLIGVFLVLRRLSLLGDSLAHASFGGIAIGIVAGVNPFISALVLVGALSLGLDRLINKIKLYGESAIAIVLSFGMATALLLISIVDRLNSTIFSYLFGSLLTISWNDVYIMIGVLICVLLFYYKYYSLLLYSTFNREVAIVKDKRTYFVEKVFLVLSALVVVISIKAVGVLLISALLVIPSLIGLKLAQSMKMTLIIATVSSIIGIYGGIVIAYLFDLPIGGVIVMSLIVLFTLSFGVEYLKSSRRTY